MSGHLEPTNKPYAIAKIAGIELCKSYREQYGCNFISAMPTNLYGPNDNFNLESYKKSVKNINVISELSTSNNHISLERKDFKVYDQNGKRVKRKKT